MSIQYGFALNANTAAVTDAQGRVTSAVPGVAGTVLTANLNAEPTFQPISLPANSTLVTPIISGATTKFTGLSGPETNPTATLVLDAGGNVKYSNKSGTGSVVMTNTATLTTPVIDGATSKFTSLSVNTAPTALVSLDGSGNINYTARTGTGTMVMSIAPNISQAELSGLATNSAPTAVLTQQGSDVVGFTTLTGSGPIVAQTSPSLTSPVVTGLKSSDLSTNSLVATDATAPRNLTSLAPGTSGQVLTSNGSGALPSYTTIIPGIISNVRQFEFIPTGLIQFYVPSVGCTKFYVELQGAGGSGGCPGNTNASTGGGGGGGAYCGFWMTNTNSITPNPGYTPPPAGHYLLNPGIPGVPISNTFGQTGDFGNPTDFGINTGQTIRAGGGGGGGALGIGGTAGTVSTVGGALPNHFPSDFKFVNGAAGRNGVTNVLSTFVYNGGDGGNSYWSQGGTGAAPTPAYAAQQAFGPGGGGGGGAVNPSATYYASGAGGNGYILISEWFN